jgi:hypothetical protein
MKDNRKIINFIARGERMSNQRLESVAKVLLSGAISEDVSGINQKTLAEYRKDAAAALVMSDSLLFAPENVAKAISKAGYEPDEHLEMVLKVINELNGALDEGVSVSDMRRAWAKGHENGFWDARTTNKPRPSYIGMTWASTQYFTKSDERLAEAAGYCSGYDNGLLSKASFSDDDATPLLGAQHEEVTNPFKVQETNNEETTK